MYTEIRLYVQREFDSAIPVELSEKQAHYLRQVMRCKEGEEIALFNGEQGEWRAALMFEGKKRVSARLIERMRPQTPSPDFWLVFAPLKSGPVDYLAQKAAELGVRRLLPVRTERTAVSRLNLERLRANAIEGAEQTGRLDVPEIEEMQPLEALFAHWPDGRKLIFCDETGGGAHPARLLPSLPETQGLALLIGPEGGFSPRELERLRSLPYARAMSLGPRILRADTAAIAALTCLQLFRGDW